MLLTNSAFMYRAISAALVECDVFTVHALWPAQQSGKRNVGLRSINEMFPGRIVLAGRNNSHCIHERKKTQ